MDGQFLKITEAVYSGGYNIVMTFSNGEVRKLDFTPLMKDGICRKLQDKDYFRNFSLDPYTIDWNNEIGFAPEYLYEISTPVLTPNSHSSYNQPKDQQGTCVAEPTSIQN